MTADRAEIRQRLNADRAWSLYALADLDEGLFEHCDWWVNSSALVLVCRAIRIRPVFLMGGTEAVRELLKVAETPYGYLNLKPEHEEAARGLFRIDEPHRMVRMVLQDFQPRDGATVVLGREDAEELEALYRSCDGAGIAFDRAQLDTGFFRGIRQGGALVAAAGVHVVSRAEGVAGAGNVITRPDYRGRGMAQVTTSAVVRDLRAAGIPLIGLNVEVTNAPARRAYERLGFREHVCYVEGMANRVE